MWKASSSRYGENVGKNEIIKNATIIYTDYCVLLMSGEKNRTSDPSPPEDTLIENSGLTISSTLPGSSKIPKSPVLHPANQS